MGASLSYRLKNNQNIGYCDSDTVKHLQELFPSMKLTRHDYDKLETAWIITQKAIYDELRNLISTYEEIELVVEY